MGKERDDHVVRENVKEFLKCILTETEKRDLAELMALSISNLTEVEGRLKSVTTQIKSEVAKYEAELTGSSEKYRSGFEMRNVECQIEKDYRLGKVTLIRLDTGEIVKERSMSAEERQQKLPLAEG